jgi:hypothetical protein
LLYSEPVLCFIELCPLPKYLRAEFSFHVSAEYCEKYVKPEDADVVPEDKFSDEELGNEDDDNSGDEEIMGKPDP